MGLSCKLFPESNQSIELRGRPKKRVPFTKLMGLGCRVLFMVGLWILEHPRLLGIMLQVVTKL